MRYIVHPRLELNIFTARKNYVSYFENEYRKVSGHAPDDARTVIDVYIVDRLPNRRAGDRIARPRFKGLFIHEYLIRDLDTQHVSIYFRDRITGRVYSKLLTLFLQAQLLEPVMYYKLLDHNILFMHAAAVSDGKNGYLFPAHGGTGKTTLALGLMVEGMDLLGDDLLLVEPDTRMVSPYLRPLHIFSYNLNTLRGAKVPLLIQAKVALKDLIRPFLELITGQEFLISTRVHADILYRAFRPAAAVPYRKILFLTSTGPDHMIATTCENLPGLARQILESGDLNASLYANVLEPAEVPIVVERELQVIGRVLKQVAVVEFINVRGLNYQDLAAFKQGLLAG